MDDEIKKLAQVMDEHPADHFIASDVDDVVVRTGPEWIKRGVAKFGTERILRGHTAEYIHKTYRYLDYVPWVQEDEEVWEFLGTLSKSHEAHAHDPRPEDLALLLEIHHEIIPIGVFITGRCATLAPTTEAVFRRNNIPEAPAIHRPDDMEYEAVHARKKLILRSLPRVIGILEDHPKMPHHLYEHDPYEGELFHLTEARPMEHPRITTCPTLQHVRDALATRFRHGKRI